MFLFMVAAFLAAVALLVTPAGQIALYKARYYAYGTVFLFRSNDLPKTYRGSNFIRMKKVGNYPSGKRTVRIVFVRHGQSDWNSLFNSFNLGWPKRAITAAIREFVAFFTKPFESAIIDSPLSSKGRKDANDLAVFVRASKMKMSFDPNTSVVVTSNLRRAMETALVGYAPRLTTTKERMVVDSSLQEGSRNIDAQSFSTEPYKLAPMTIGSIKDPQQLIAAFDPCLNMGNKVIGVDVYQRMDAFIEHIFGGGDDGNALAPAAPGKTNADLTEIIVVGHSGYFRNFFRRFLPEASKHVAKKQKMQNCAVVAFDLSRNESNGEVSVEESSIKVLYKGFK